MKATPNDMRPMTADEKKLADEFLREQAGMELYESKRTGIRDFWPPWESLSSVARDLWKTNATDHAKARKHALAVEAQAVQRRLARAAVDLPACIWHQDEDSGAWESGCGYAWSIEGRGSPDDHGMNFCPSCGCSLLVTRKEPS